MSDPPTARTLVSRCRTPDVPLPAGTPVGDWTITGRVGAGGMATVYAATAADGRVAALKLAHRGLFDSALRDEALPAETFLREARIAGAVAHGGAASVLGTGTHDGRPYLALELLSGASLGARLDAGEPQPPAATCELALELVDVLGAAHAAGITHRDLKPDNIFLLAPRADRRLKLLDWGVAHVAGEADPFHGMIAGTLTYVAPEQIRGDELTPAADIYSLGVLAYRLLCSRPPFAARSDLELLKLHLHAPPPHARLACPAVPAPLDGLLAAMLAKDPADRPALAEIAGTLRAVLHALAPPPARPARWLPLVRGLARVGALCAILA